MLIIGRQLPINEVISTSNGGRDAMKRTRTPVLFALGAIAILMTALATGFIVRAAAGTEIDMTIADNEVAYNDAIFAQGPIDVNSAGTGVIDPFLTVPCC
jgi:hypothetical protein